MKQLRVDEGCECTDTLCCHYDAESRSAGSACPNPASVKLHRWPLRGAKAVRVAMCDDCADGAVMSGLFERA